MKKLALSWALALCAVGNMKAQSVLFGRDGLVTDRAQALAELVPWKAPNTALRLADEKVSYLGGGSYAITRTVVNAGDAPLAFKDEVRVRDCFAATRYLIPCVLYNGNEFGTLQTPKGLTHDGQPWVFSYERTGIPSCTLTENKDVGFALFAAADTKDSLVSSCSIESAEGGRYEHVVVRPVTEAPVVYESKGVFGPRTDGYVTLGPGKSFTATTYACVCPPKWENYAAASLIEKALALLKPELAPCMRDEEVFDVGTEFVKSLLYRFHGKWLVITHYSPRIFPDQHGMKITREEMAERLKWPYWTDMGTYHERFEVGWADQNFLNARMLAVRALARGEKDLLEKAIGVFEAFVSTQRENGLLYACWEVNTYHRERAVQKFPVDVCNLGWAAAEAVRMYQLLRRNGVDKPEYLSFARKICDFCIDHWSDENGFGKSWHLDGRPGQTFGSIGGFMIPALMEVYGETHEKRYLDAAQRASDFYYARDLDKFETTAGALDCQCIDKETAYPFLQGSLMLYRATRDRKHLARAEKAAYYFTSWMFFFDGVYGAETDFAKYGYHTTGGTSVSAEHTVIDSWGSIMPPDLLELAELTGNDSWRTVARLMWANAIQGITTDPTQLVHGQQRPVGGQNEAFFQARFTKYRPVIEAGYWNDCLPAWVGAYRMWTVDRLRAKGLKMR